MVDAVPNGGPENLVWIQGATGSGICVLALFEEKDLRIHVAIRNGLHLLHTECELEKHQCLRHRR